jgi:predicted DNA binding CopG/RHH family protein
MKLFPKKLPKFASEDEEREFWANNSPLDYVDKNLLRANPPMPSLKPSTEVVTFRLSTEMLDKLKMDANRQGLPYQSYMKSLLYKALFNSSNK